MKRSKSDPKKAYYCSKLEVDPKNPARALTQWERPNFRAKTVADLNNLQAAMPPGWAMEERPRLPARQQYAGRGRPVVSEPTAAELGGVPLEDRVLLFLNSAADIAELDSPAFDPIANRLSVAWPGYESTYTGKEFERLLGGLLSWDPTERYFAMSEMRALYASTEASSRLTQGGHHQSPANSDQWLAETRAGDAAAAHAAPERPNPRAVQPRSLNSTLVGDEHDEASASGSGSGSGSAASSDCFKSASSAKREVEARVSSERAGTDSSAEKKPDPATAAPNQAGVATRNARRKSRGRSCSGSSSDGDGGAGDAEGQGAGAGQGAGTGLGKRRSRAESGDRGEKASIFEDGWEGDASVGAELARRPVVNMADYIHRQGVIAANSKDFATGWESHPELHFEIIKLFNSRPTSAEDPTPGQKFTLRFDKVYPQSWNAALFGTGTGRRSKDFNSNDEHHRLQLEQEGRVGTARPLLRICRVSDATAREMEWECEALLQDSDVTIFFDDLRDDSSDNENEGARGGSLLGGSLQGSGKRRRYAEKQGDEPGLASTSALGDLGGSSASARHQRVNANTEKQSAAGSKRKQPIRGAKGEQQGGSAGRGESSGAGGGGDGSSGSSRRLRSRGTNAA